MHGAHDFVVAPMLIDGMTVDSSTPAGRMFGHSEIEPVDAYLARRDQAAFAAGLAELHGAVVSRLNRPPRRAGATNGPPPGGVFVIQMRLVTYHPEVMVQRSNGTGTMPARAQFFVRLFTSDGRLLDEIGVDAVPSGLISDTVHPEVEVLAHIGETLGSRLAQYLDDRVR